MNETYEMLGSCFNCGTESIFSFTKGEQTNRKYCPHCGCCTVATFRLPDKKESLR
jgi:hypothetical protein